MKTWFLLIFLLFSFSSIRLTAQVDEEASTLVKAGETAPNFRYTSADGTSIQLSDLKGKLVLINFFATWCGPCMQELPRLQSDIYDKYKAHPDFVLLVIGREHSTDELKIFNDKKGFSFNLIADPKREIYSAFAKQYIPRNFLIGKDGKVIYSAVGFDNAEFEQLKELIANHLN